MSTIAIIGAQGMLGQELARIFKKQKPLLLDRPELDITDQSEVQRWVSDTKPDVVINAAAYNDVDGAEQHAALAQAINKDGPKYLATALAASGGILVHYSTDYVFDGTQKEGYLEADTPHPQSVYARSKFAGEKAVRDALPHCYIIRLSRLFGRPAAGEGAKQSFVDKIIARAKESDTIQAIDEEVSCPTYAPDLALQTQRIIQQRMSYGIYHVTNAGACTWYGFAQEIFAQAKINARLEPVPGSMFPRAAQRPAYSILLNTKLPELRSWQVALRDYLKHGI